MCKQTGILSPNVLFLQQKNIKTCSEMHVKLILTPLIIKGLNGQYVVSFDTFRAVTGVAMRGAY